MQTIDPTQVPTFNPSTSPSTDPTSDPTSYPSANPTRSSPTTANPTTSVPTSGQDPCQAFECRAGCDSYQELCFQNEGCLWNTQEPFCQSSDGINESTCCYSDTGSSTSISSNSELVAVPSETTTETPYLAEGEALGHETGAETASTAGNNTSFIGLQIVIISIILLVCICGMYKCYQNMKRRKMNEFMAAAMRPSDEVTISNSGGAQNLSPVSPSCASPPLDREISNESWKMQEDINSIYADISVQIPNDESKDNVQINVQSPDIKRAIV